MRRREESGFRKKRVSLTDEGQGFKDDDITWKAEEGEGESR